MRHSRLFVTGLILLVGGMAVIAIGSASPTNDPVVALGWLTLAPLLVSLCGTVLVFVSLVRRSARSTRGSARYRIVRLFAVAGLGLGLAYPVAGILSQVPDSVAGLNGTYVYVPPLPGVLLCCGVGLFVGVAVGALAAWVWLSLHARQPRAR
jgi:xanthine/uracil/vitamin C permease (AzgA family)